MINWEVLQFSSNGTFDHGTFTKEEALDLVLPGPEEGVACSVFREEPCSAKCTSLRAAISMSSRASSAIPKGLVLQKKEKKILTFVYVLLYL